MLMLAVLVCTECNCCSKTDSPIFSVDAGEVPGLFSNEELAKELMPLEQKKNEDNTYSGPNTTYAYFTYRCAAYKLEQHQLCVQKSSVAQTS